MKKRLRGNRRTVKSELVLQYAGYEKNREEEIQLGEQTESRKEHHIWRMIIAIAAVIICTIGVFFALTSRWAFETWPNLKVEEMLFQLTNNVKGTGGGILEAFFRRCLIPSLAVLAGTIILLVLVRKHPRMMRTAAAVELCTGLALSFSSVHTFYVKADVKGYLEAQGADSSFIEENYVDPASASITFPEQKRNLIYIYLESMEMTYADEENGGGFAYNCIPELTELAKENECFSGNSGVLNGAYAYPNADYTSAAMFAQTSGLPLQLNTDIYSLNNHDVFYPGISTIGTILAAQGYQNTLLIGSKGDFGNRASYFTNHGSYEIRDYQYAVEQGWIPSDYRVWWGYEDEKLFANAKTTLDELSDSDQPFNLTMLTVDTHFEDGYVCDLCDNEFDTQYANVMHCSSKQVVDFVNWCKTQSWYDNTTIVINGDHNTMDADFCDDVSSSYERRTYTCYINSAVEPETPDRVRSYTTQDSFPTTLAALGCQIEGDRLGLGTNLFSNTDTLNEVYGTDMVSQEMRNKSDWLIELSNVSSNYGCTVSYLPREDGGLSIYANNFTGIMQQLVGVTITAETETGSVSHAMTLQSDGSYAVKLSSSESSYGNSFHVKLTIHLEDGTSSTVYERLYRPDLQSTASLLDYISILKQEDDDILLAWRPTSLKGIDSGARELLNELGFVKMPRGTKAAYTGALTNDGVEERMVSIDGEKAEQDGTLSAGNSFKLTSAGGVNTDIARVSINGQNAAVNGIGLNFVIVDRDTGLILDSACYNPEDGTLIHN
jgi:phosphoglycerol transferase